MINLYTIGAAILALTLLTSGSYLWGRTDGINIEQGRQTEMIQKARTARETRRMSKAEGIARLRTENARLRREANREYQTADVYSDCKHTPVGMRYIRDALRGKPGPGSGAGLPRDIAAAR